MTNEAKRSEESDSTVGLGGVTIYRHFCGMCWPAAGDGLANLEWSMRYGNSEQQRMVAASVISAYSRIIELPEKRRNAIIRELRKGPGKESPNVKLTRLAEGQSGAAKRSES